MRDLLSFLKVVCSDSVTDFLFGLVAILVLVTLAPTLALYLFLVVSCALGVVFTVLVTTIIGHLIKEKFNV